MVRISTLIVVLIISSISYASLLQAQGSKQRAPKEQMNLPTDPKLLELHREFVTKAEKLGEDYLKKKDLEKARVVFGEILKLVPAYPPAKERMQQIQKSLSESNKKLFVVEAKLDWQDTEIDLQEGTPISFEVDPAGKWLFVHESGADGIQIPKEFRDYKLGSLIGMIVQSSGEKPAPFIIGKGRTLSAPNSGRLFLKMHDGFNEDNRGSIKVVISGNF